MLVSGTKRKPIIRKTSPFRTEDRSKVRKEEAEPRVKRSKIATSAVPITIYRIKLGMPKLRCLAQNWSMASLSLFKIEPP